MKLRTPIKITWETEKNLLVDPCRDNPTEHFSFSETGTIVGVTQKGEITADLLKLNRPNLVRSRYKQIQPVIKICREIGRHKLSQADTEKALEEIFGSSELPWRGIARHIAGQQLYEAKNLLPKKYREIIEVTQRKITTGKPRAKRTLSKTASTELSKHIYLDKLQLKNYTCFSDLEIKFAESDRSLQTADGRYKEPWMLFLGENGVGKSSLLRAIALCLMDAAYRKRTGNKPRDILRNGTKSGYIKLFLKGETQPISLVFDSKRFKQEGFRPVNLVGYGAIRVLPRGPLKIGEGRPFPVKTMNLFDYTVALHNAQQWLLRLSPGQFAEAALALKDLLQLGDETAIKRVPRSNQIIRDDGETKIPIEQLSDGYKTVLALAVDIMSSFIHAKHSFDTAEGVVLVDEIGTHLHPTWKMAIVNSLRNTFPKIQFFVTTHEPLCLRGLGKGEVMLLKKSVEGTQVFTDLPDPSLLRIDELLTSDYFGLHSTVDPVVEKQFIEYYSLLAKPKRQLTAEEKKNIRELKDILPHDRELGLDLRDEVVYAVVDDILAHRKTFEPIEKLKQRSIDLFNKSWKKVSARKRPTRL